MRFRFKEGSKVEVLDKREVPCGSWCCAKIVSSNGHYYSVKYDCYSGDTGVTVERVSRKAIRPCPPPVLSPRCWVPGDIGEVFEKNSWKLAEVSRVVGANYFFVRLLGSSRKLRVHISNLRMRLVWEDNTWVVIQKESGECNNGVTNSQSRPVDFSNGMPHSCIEAKTCQGDDQFSKNYDSSFQEPCSVPLGGKKRRPCLHSPQINSCTGARKKMRSVEETGRQYRILGTVSSHLLEKVDVGASSQALHGAKYMHTLNYRTSGFCEMKMDEPDVDVGYNFVGCLEPNDAKSTFSSVGSCSVGSEPYRSLYDPMTRQTQGMDNQYNDTASSHGSGEPSLPMKEGLPDEIHCLELTAYRSTMAALYASGPLNWEQEILLTNLRLTLHISSDEHLLELKHLMSARNRYLL